jgi:hypothetical protein
LIFTRNKSRGRPNLRKRQKWVQGTTSNAVVSLSATFLRCPSFLHHHRFLSSRAKVFVTTHNTTPQDVVGARDDYKKALAIYEECGDPDAHAEMVCIFITLGGCGRIFDCDVRQLLLLGIHGGTN